MQINVEYPARVSSVGCGGVVGFTPVVNGGILSLQEDSRRVPIALIGAGTNART